ncbi:carboxymuconolactone decarboxylase family protein [Winogradskyella sp. UBA3174]|uniref:carboxymuconolactone decarboxylase family protein n=1 Tax=Winogradskyella sp. UBA3174 TaxID=1947785 RepID=UPI0025D31FF5|nr:carboxymuconolactone decarboxylase family protein [Winogradskyella sp. UBA3174]|tara:strand:- start:4712 stop:5266 length:555 start_codon:yes stop_codon:yes gene_type:complete
MKILKSLGFKEANTNSQEIFNAVKGKIGMVPNLYAAMSVSDKLLGGFLTFTETLKSGEFSSKEYEAIALATSQANDCAYCLSAHTAIGKMNGFTEQDILDIRGNSIADSKLNALVTLASELVNLKGHPTNTTADNFFEAGFNKAAFAEVIAIVALTTITNNVYHNGGFEIDFPKAQHLEQSQDV